MHASCISLRTCPSFFKWKILGCQDVIEKNYARVSPINHDKKLFLKTDCDELSWIRNRPNSPVSVPIQIPTSAYSEVLKHRFCILIAFTSVKFLPIPNRWVRLDGLVYLLWILSINRPSHYSSINRHSFVRVDTRSRRLCPSAINFVLTWHSINASERKCFLECTT